MVRANWRDLPWTVRGAVEARIGRVVGASTVRGGANSRVAAVLKTETGTAFAKGLRVNDHGTSTQLREAAAAPLVARFSPGLLARVCEDGWDINIFAHVGGRHPSYAPGSGDLSAVADVMRGVGRVPCPALPVFKRAEQRWWNYYDVPAAAGALAGTTLLHTDWNPFNVLIAPVGARVVDWAWATLGAPWVDPACWVIRLIAAGHSPESAEREAASVPAWHAGSGADLDAFARANARLWSEIAAHDAGSPTISAIGTAARQWSRHRGG